MRAELPGIFTALILAAASPAGLSAQPLFDAPYRWFPSYAPVHAVAAWPRWHRTGAFAVGTHTDEMSIEVFAAELDGDLVSTAIIPVPSHPHGVVIADFDGDDCPDLAAGCYDPPGIVLIRGRCAGKFDAPVFFPCPTSVEGLAVDDIDANGHPDLLGWSSEGAVVVLNDETGGFGAPIALSGSYPHPIAVGRIDSDPYPDIGVITSTPGVFDSLTIRFGRGDGTFGSGHSFGIGEAGGTSTSFVDLDGDGHLDVVVGLNEGPLDGAITELVNDGSGNLARPVCPAAPINLLGGSPQLFTGGDVDGDGHQDLFAIAESKGGPVVTLALGNSCGSFGAAFTRDAQSFSPGVFADVDGDGREDFLQPDGAGVSLFTGSASGRLGLPPLQLGWDTGWGGMFAARVDDGPTLDLVVPDFQLETYDILFGTGGGGFVLGYSGRTHPGHIAVADLDLDGHNDIVTSSWPTSSDISMGDGSGTFTMRQSLSIGGVLAVMRSEGDLHPEVLVLSPDSLFAFRDRGDTVYEPSRAWPGGGDQLVVCDLNADGRDDAIIGNGGDLSVRLGGSDGLGPALAGPATFGGAIQVVDLDGDGQLDVVAGNGAGSPSWLRGRGDGTFDPPSPLTLPPASSYAFADWNGDGTLDAAVLSGKVGIAFGTGGGSFSTPIWFGTGYKPTALVAGDLNGDGRPDLAVQDSYTGQWGDHYGRIDLLINNIPSGSPLAVGGAPAARAPVFSLGPARPNPLRDGTRMYLSRGAAAQVDVRVLDIAGRQVRVLLHGAARAGGQDVPWDARDASGRKVPPGIYLVTARDASTSITRRVVVLQ